MKNIPKVIYLNIGDIGQDVFDEESFNDLAREEITWSEDRIDEFDIEYTESGRLVPHNHGSETMPKIAEVKKMALQELELQDTKDDIANEDVSRKELWRSAFECGVIALINKLDSNFSA